MTRSVILLSLALGAAPGGFERLAPIPDREGVAGAFAGVSGGSLVVAGGANFPDKKPRDGGAKLWHDAVYVLDRPDGTWKAAGKLPRPLAYGVSVTHRGAVVCAGGSDATKHYPDCFRLEWADAKLSFTPLPPLPQPVANACGALLGDTLIVAGGQQKLDSAEALKTVFALDLSAEKPAWKELPAWPGRPRMLAVAAAFDGAFWLVGGVDLEPGADGKPRRKYLRDAFRYDPAQGWSQVADLPHPVAAAPSPAPADERGFYLLGGDDGSNVGFAPPQKHPGFTKQVLRFDPMARKWVPAGEWSAPRVTVPAVRWNGVWVIPSGEARPGVRSPDVWAFTPGGTR